VPSRDATKSERPHNKLMRRFNWIFSVTLCHAGVLDKLTHCLAWGVGFLSCLGCAATLRPLELNPSRWIMMILWMRQIRLTMASQDIVFPAEA